MPISVRLDEETEALLNKTAKTLQFSFRVGRRKMILLDTGPIVAFFDASDHYHPVCN